MIEHCLPHTLDNLAHWAASNKGEPKDTVLTVWKKKLDTEDDHLVIRFLFLLQVSNDRIIDLIRDSDHIRENKKIQYKQAVKGFGNLISVSRLNDNWRSLAHTCATDKNAAYMSAIAESLHSFYPKEEIEEHEIAELTNKLEKIKNELEQKVSDILLRNYLVKELELMSLCLKHFEMLGGMGIEEAAGNILKKCITQRDKIPSQILKKILGISLSSLRLLSLIGGAYAGAEAIANGGAWLSEVTQDISNAEMPDIKLLEDQSVKSDDQIDV